MALNAGTIVERAYARSRKNKPGDLTADVEVLQRVNVAVRTFIMIGSRVNPEYFGTEATVVWSGGVSGWPRPATAEMVFLITFNGDETVVVPFDDRQSETALPAVYRLGQVYRPRGNAGDPTNGDSLVLTFARRPVDCTALSGEGSTIDAIYPDAFDELLITEVATYLALKDERMGEADRLKQERDDQLRIFLAHLEHETVGVARRRARVRYSGADPVASLSALLAGGTKVQLPG